MRAPLIHLAGMCVIVSGCAHSAQGPSNGAPAEVTTDVRADTTKPAGLETTAGQQVFRAVQVDLRERLTGLGLTPRAQGHRGTCSIFTTCEAIEYAMAMRDGKAERMSPEFLNWTGAQIIGRPTDGNFFHNALAGYATYGLCRESAMPYARDYDAQRSPSAEALKSAAAEREMPRNGLVVHWIVPWAANKTGVNESEFAEIKRVLRSGYPVAAGSGHSRLLVGYVDDAKVPGGGKFYTEDSALARFDEVTYEFVTKQVNDVFWVEANGRK